MKPLLRISILFHPESDLASSLAKELFEELAAGPDDLGLRIPVSFHASTDGRPLPVMLEDAHFTLVVALVDSRMSRRVPSREPADAWADMVCNLLELANASDHAMLPVALDRGAFDLDDRLNDVSFIRLEHVPVGEKSERLLFHVCAAALHLLEGGEASTESAEQAPVTLFLSHAKAELPKKPDAGDDDPVHALMLELAQGPVDSWFDAAAIPAGGRFPKEISEGVLSSSAVIAVVTNTWSSREWCRREVLEAKEARRPILVIDHITDEKPRLFPYLGNAPVMRWRERGSARKAVIFAVREALRYRHNLISLKSRAAENEVVFGTKPELLSIAHVPETIDCVVYPDPPLGQEELKELRRIAPDVSLTTPLSRLADFEGPRDWNRVALSLSTAGDAVRYGGSPSHFAALADDLNLFLMLAGLCIAYGGSLTPAGVDPEFNYTERLFSTALSYSPLSQQLREGKKFELIQNYVAWPIHLGYGDDEYSNYRNVATIRKIEKPEALKLDPAELEIGQGEFFEPNTAQRRFAWARGLTTMREVMRDEADIGARIAVGGKLSGYSGRYPGVLEEVLLDLRESRPVYLVGAYGGAARLAYDALIGENREELSTPWVMGETVKGEPRVSFYEEMRQRHCEAGIEMKSPEELAEEFAEMGRGGIAAALNNGLSDEENHELVECVDSHRIVELVLRGLSRVRASAE